MTSPHHYAPPPAAAAAAAAQRQRRRQAAGLTVAAGRTLDGKEAAAWHTLMGVMGLYAAAASNVTETALHTDCSRQCRRCHGYGTPQLTSFILL